MKPKWWILIHWTRRWFIYWGFGLKWLFYPHLFNETTTMPLHHLKDKNALQLPRKGQSLITWHESERKISSHNYHLRLDQNYLFICFWLSILSSTIIIVFSIFWAGGSVSSHLSFPLVLRNVLLEDKQMLKCMDI